MNTLSILSAGENFLSADFGFAPPAEVGTIGDLVWSDLNGNGVRDAGEPGIAGVTIILTYPSNLSITATTDNNGNYLFTDLPEGDYTVTVTQGPEGSTLTTPQSFNIGLDEGEDYLLADFGFEPAPELGSIGDLVWSDLDGDGVRDAGELGIAGVIVSITYPDGSTESTATNGFGEYIFDGLEEGSYAVVVGDGPEGSTLTTQGGYEVDLSEGEDFLAADFGFEPAEELGSIGDLVWMDLNGNGVRDTGEPGIGGIVVTLTNGEVTLATTTDNNGNYLFSDLPADNYTVTVGEGSEGATLTTAGSYDVNLAEGQDFLTADFGFEPAPELGSIGDTVFSDLNGNGTQDDGEVGLPNIVVTLTLPDGSTLTTATNGNGEYIFTDLPAGSYTVAVGEGPEGATLSTPASFNVDLDEGEDFLTADFGFEPAPGLGSIGDYVWLDTDLDGNQDDDEDGIEGITVTLVYPSGITATTTTNENGFYIFEDLPAGTYNVFVGAGPANTSLTTVGNYTVDLASEEDYEDADFGFGPVAQLGAIGDTVFEDTNGNGVQDDGEQGIAGITVTLTLPDGSTQTTTTNGAGAYLFDELPAGNYTVEVGDGPTGSTLTTAGSFNISLDEGEEDLTADFGFEPAADLGSIAGTVFEDTNGNGVQDPGEPGIGGVIVLLEPENGPNIITTTDENGVYIFTGLPEDSYTVSVTNPPAGMNPTTSTTQDVDLGPGENVTDVDFGFQPQLGSIGDFVFFDLNGNGQPDGLDFGIGGIEVTLIFPDGTTQTTTTDDNGFYSFTDLPAGDYIVSVGEGPEETTLTTPSSYGVDLDNGENYVDADFGFEADGGGGGQEICSPEYTVCAEPMTPVEICPEYPCLDEGWQIQSAHTTYNCSLNIIDDCLRYTALPLFAGNDTIEIVACDAFKCDTAFVYITVTDDCIQNVNEAPIAEDDLTVTEEDTTVKIPVLNNDSDPDGDEISVTSFTEPSNGTVVLSGGVFIYTPNPDFVGVDSFTYQICDPEGLCDVATVTIEVRPAPCDDELFFCTEPLTPLEICPEFCDLQGSDDVVITNAHTTYNCSLQLGDDGKCLQYTALPLFAGMETVTIVGCNGAGICDTVTVSIQVTGCDDIGDGGTVEIGDNEGDTTVTPVGVPDLETDTPMDDNDNGEGGDDEEDGSGKTATPSEEMIGQNETKLIINSLIPVPAIDFINVTFTAQDGDATISIFDLTGKLLDQISHRTENGMNMKRIDITPYPTGVYVIKIDVEGQTISSKFFEEGELMNNWKLSITGLSF